MRNLFGRFICSCLCAGLLIAGTTVQAEEGALFSLKAVKKNPLCTNPGAPITVCGGDRQCDTGPLAFDGQCGGGITPTNTVSAEPGNIIVAEIFGSNWSPTGQRLQSFQFTIDEAGYTSGGGQILPLGWDPPPTDVFCAADEDCPAGMFCDTGQEECKARVCTSDPDCPPEWPVCRARRCAGPNHDPESGAFVDEFRVDELDWVFRGCSVLGAIDMSTLGYRYGWVISGSLLCAPTYTEPEYFGTLMLVVPQDACGTFTIPFLPHPDTVMVDTNGQFIEPIKTEPLTIQMVGGPCVCRLTGSSTPPNCALDGRQPSEPDGTSEAGWSEIKLDLDEDCSSCLIAGRFSVRQFPADFGNPISVSNEQCTGPKEVTVTLDRRISTNTWTCVRYLESDQEVCVGYLPGDSDANSISDEADILHLIDCVNGNETCEIHQCDVDRSGLCGPADLLREIDLLNGAETFDVWLGQEIERFGSRVLCPTAP